MNRTHIRAAATMLAASLAVALSGCAGTEGAPAEATVTVTETVTASPSPEESENTSESASSEPAESADSSPSPEAAEDSSMPDVSLVGETATHAGVTLTVNEATASPTVSLNKSGYRAGSGYESYTATPADEGGRYVIVKTTIKNTGRESMDLTCSWPINIKVLDDEMREFDTIDSLHEVQGNPECNAQLQPGFSDDVTYVFMVPKSAKIVGLYFQDTNDLGDEAGLFKFDPAL